MSLFYQPLSRSLSQRDSGCLTPNQPESDTNDSNAKTRIGDYDDLIINSKNHHRKNSILSPPLSPYQRNNETNSIPQQHYQPSKLSKSYLNHSPSKPFKIENFKDYELSVSPWNNLSSNYKQRQVYFLEKYSIISNKEFNTYSLSSSSSKSTERRGQYKKRFAPSDSDSDSNLERIRTRRLVKENSVNLPSESESSLRSSSPSPKKRKVKKETSYANSPLAIQQASFIDENIPDYSPDPSLTLPNGNNRALKIEWKGQPMDLRNDPNISKLHPAEVILASTLRLPCNVYLDSKRRLFFEKVDRFTKGMQFRRTDAQKACRIDVNKASRLFAAFEKVGWLKDEHFAKYL